MPTRIGAISPVSATSPAWPASRGPHTPPVPLPGSPGSPVPAATAAPAGSPGALASMGPALLPSLVPGLMSGAAPGLAGLPVGGASAAAVSEAVGSALSEALDHAFGRQPASARSVPATRDPGLLATLPAAQMPPQATLLRPGSAPAAPLAAAWRAQVLTGNHASGTPTAPATASGAMLQAGLPIGNAAAGAARGTMPWPAAGTWAAAEFPALATQALAAPATAAASSTALNLPSAPLPDRLSFLLHAWNGQPVALRLVEPEPDDPPATALPRGLPALRLAVDLPMLGRILMQLQLAPGGVWLAMAVEYEPAVPFVQAALPAFTHALAQTGLRLLRWRLERGTGHGTAFANLPLHLPPSATMLAPALFRAAAEVVLVLQEVDAAVAGAAGIA